MPSEKYQSPHNSDTAHATAMKFQLNNGMTSGMAELRQEKFVGVLVCQSDKNNSIQCGVKKVLVWFCVIVSTKECDVNFVEG